ncbi:MAG TPA: HPr family phosphocarrier protein [Gemmatimonadales bacterium]|jgi:phosphocarrier protein|nr:HPr family phosphocarrier protein [Gemmatimonadales bacterium]
MPITREVQVVNPLGLHARPAAQLVKLASQYQSEITIARDGMPVNAKSIMGVMMLAAECGCRLTLQAEGSDAPEALEALAGLVAAGFGES